MQLIKIFLGLTLMLAGFLGTVGLSGYLWWRVFSHSLHHGNVVNTVLLAGCIVFFIMGAALVSLIFALPAYFLLKSAEVQIK